MSGNVLLVGELIANGGVGLQGDIIATTALGCKPLVAAALMSTIRNPLNRVFRVVDTEFIIQQIKDCREKPGADCIKIGALGNEEMVNEIATYISKNKVTEPIVYCPILVSDMGAPLLDVSGIQTLQKYLVPLIDVLVINIYDAEILTGVTISETESMKKAAEQLIDFGAKAVLITGGLLDGMELCDVYMDKKKCEVLRLPKHEAHLENNFRFGGAWVLATAIATGLAKGMSLMEAINRGRQYIDTAIELSTQLGDRYQSLALTHTISKFKYDETVKAYEVVQGA